jgi:hypothetical protein
MVPSDATLAAAAKTEAGEVTSSSSVTTRLDAEGQRSTRPRTADAPRDSSRHPKYTKLQEGTTRPSASSHPQFGLTKCLTACQRAHVFDLLKTFSAIASPIPLFAPVTTTRCISPQVLSSLRSSVQASITTLAANSNCNFWQVFVHGYTVSQFYSIWLVLYNQYPCPIIQQCLERVPS